MRNTLNILFFLLIASVLHAQAPVIDHLEVDEAKNQLKIVGSFQSLSGQVSIDDTLVGVVSWSDSLIIAELPMSGRGSGGAVVVQDVNDSSNKRTLSIFKATISNPLYYFDRNPHPGGFQLAEYKFWYVNWRADINNRYSESDSLVKFEISQSSYGDRPGNGFAYLNIRWADTSALSDTCISLSGTFNIAIGRISFDSAVMKTPSPFSGIVPTVIYYPKDIFFDTTGSITGYIDSGTVYQHQKEKKWDNRLYDQVFLFPPSPKSTVNNYKSQEDGVKVVYEISNGTLKILLSISDDVSAVVSLVDVLGRKVIILYSGIIDAHTRIETDINSTSQRVSFLEVAVKGVKHYFKLPIVL